MPKLVTIMTLRALTMLITTLTTLTLLTISRSFCYLLFTRLSGGFPHFLACLLAILTFLGSPTVLLFTSLSRTCMVKELIKAFIHLRGTKLSLLSAMVAAMRKNLPFTNV